MTASALGPSLRQDTTRPMHLRIGLLECIGGDCGPWRVTLTGQSLVTASVVHLRSVVPFPLRGTKKQLRTIRLNQSVRRKASGEASLKGGIIIGEDKPHLGDSKPLKRGAISDGVGLTSAHESEVLMTYFTMLSGARNGSHRVEAIEKLGNILRAVFSKEGRNGRKELLGVDPGFVARGKVGMTERGLGGDTTLVITAGSSTGGGVGGGGVVKYGASIVQAPLTTKTAVREQIRTPYAQTTH
ncbi:hypothetical protein B0H14DRAFT_3556904 [Mycena olivaceomarginata]|nr:hypothetical protein B0H14DRAFT_3556904 [Mycena olivaceomarginata]